MTPDVPVSWNCGVASSPGAREEAGQAAGHSAHTRTVALLFGEASLGSLWVCTWCSQKQPECDLSSPFAAHCPQCRTGRRPCLGGRRGLTGVVVAVFSS